MTRLSLRSSFRVAAILAALLAPFAALAQSPYAPGPPPPVPGLPDSARQTTYTISSSTCGVGCPVGFQLYGDSTDYQNWVEVWLNGVQVQYNDPTYGWTITSPTGSLATIPRPITDAYLTFNNAQTGTVIIIGAERPRRTTEFTEGQGVDARDLNQSFNTLTAIDRELWDKTNDISGRALLFEPSFHPNPLPLASARAGQYFCFAAGTGQPTTCAGAQGSGTVAAGNGIQFNGSNPTTISTNLSAGAGITLSGSNPVAISSNSITSQSTVTGASTTYLSTQDHVLVSRSNGGAPMIDTLPGTSPGILPARTYLTVRNDDTAGVLAINVGAGAGLEAQLAPTGWIYICPGQSISFYSDGSTYWAVNQPATCYLKGATTFYAAASGGSATNNGLTASAPLDNITDAYGLAQSSFNAGLLNPSTQPVTIQGADGAYGVTTLVNRIPGQGDTNTQKGIFPVVIEGDTTTPTNATISTTSNSFGALQVNGDANLMIEGFSISTSGSGGSGLYVNRAWVAFKLMDFGSVSINQIAATHQAHVEIAGNYTWHGTIQAAWLASDGASIYMENAATVTATSTPTMNEFAVGQYGGAVNMDFTPTFAGSSVSGGLKCEAFGNGLVESNGVSFPGTGTSVNTQGQCL